MSERLKSSESSPGLIDGLRLQHPNTDLAEAARAKSSQAGSFSAFRERYRADDSVREAIYAHRNRPPHGRILSRYAPARRIEQGETKSFCQHGTYRSSGGWDEQLIISQRCWRDCDGQLEIRAHYPHGWQRASAIWLTSRSAIDPRNGYWFRIPNLSLLAIRSYNSLNHFADIRLLQIDHDSEEEIVRRLVVRDQAVSSAWGYRAGNSGPAPRVHLWSPGDALYWSDDEERLRATFAAGARGVDRLAPEAALDGIVDCCAAAEAIRAQAESGPVDLNRLARDTGLVVNPD